MNASPLLGLGHLYRKLNRVKLQNKRYDKDLTHYLWLPPMAANLNAFFQFGLRWIVALASTLLGPETGGRLNVGLWRLRGQIFKWLLKTKPSPDSLHFMHVPRTGGTSLRKLVEAMEVPSDEITLHHHGTKVCHIQNAEWFILFRDPISRLDSSLRQIARDKKNDKTRMQKRVIRWQIKNYPTLNDINEAISCKNPVVRFRGWLAMNSGGQMTEPLSAWVSVAEILDNPPVFVGHHDLSGPLESFLSKRFMVQPKQRPAVNAAGIAGKLEGDQKQLEKFFRLDYLVYEKLKSLVPKS